MSRVVLKVRRKGVVILPKALRELAGVKEGDELLAEVINGSIVLSPLKPKIVRVNLARARSVVKEEKGEWDRRLNTLARETGT